MNRQRPLILLLLVAYIFFPKLFAWVADPAGVWYKPYLIWMLVIIAAFFMQPRKSTHDA